MHGCGLPGCIKVDILTPVVAPPSIDRGAETPVPGILQSGEAVSEETLKAGLGRFQHGHVFQPAVNLGNACVKAIVLVSMDSTETSGCCLAETCNKLFT